MAFYHVNICDCPEGSCDCGPSYYVSIVYSPKADVITLMWNSDPRIKKWKKTRKSIIIDTFEVHKNFNVNLTNDEIYWIQYRMDRELKGMGI